MFGQALHVAGASRSTSWVLDRGIDVKTLRSGAPNKECPGAIYVTIAHLDSLIGSGVGGVGPRQHSIAFLAAGRIEDGPLRHWPFAGVA